MELWCRQMKYHLVPWNSMELWDCHFMTSYTGPLRNIPRNSTELWSRQIKNHKKSPRSMGFHGIFHWIPGNLVPPNKISISSMEFHGTFVLPNEVSLSSMAFHGTLRLPFYIPWNSMELWGPQNKKYRVPWDSMELGGPINTVGHNKIYSLVAGDIFKFIYWNEILLT